MPRRAYSRAWHLSPPLSTAFRSYASQFIDTMNGWAKLGLCIVLCHGHSSMLKIPSSTITCQPSSTVKCNHISRFQTTLVVMVGSCGCPGFFESYETNWRCDLLTTTHFPLQDEALKIFGCILGGFTMGRLAIKTHGV